eukprot:1215603-Pyramimonas_sp.AAC.1
MATGPHYVDAQSTHVTVIERDTLDCCCKQSCQMVPHIPHYYTGGGGVWGPAATGTLRFQRWWEPLGDRGATQTD